eukprot:TRINITY_DN3181_c1_g5_i1.p1 TRINITY_DN3181_c1_g5~~TRINITY_DN3181_c1_g5_i1.p1  ORF type:complete len:146 (+),score=26.81 TRINITY_DN3181_c1_g5_i1:270-707(+)
MFCYYYSKWKKRLLFAALQMQEKSQLILSQGLVLQSHFSSNSLFWFEEHGPEEVYIITSKDKYLSASLDGQIVGEKTKKDPSCIFRVSSQGPESISLRWILETRIKSVQTDTYIILSRSGTLGMSSNPRDTPAEFHLVYHFNTQI